MLRVAKLCDQAFGYADRMANGRNGRADLIIDSPETPGLRVHLVHDHYTLGRSMVNDLAFPSDHKLSREHLLFERVGNNWTVSDVGSRNGTQLNGARLTEKTLLVHGDQIAAGQLTISCDLCGGFADAKPDEITFVEETIACVMPTALLDLNSALEASTDLGGGPTLENAHLGALVRAGRELAGQGALEKLFELVLDLSLAAVKASRGVVMTTETEGRMVSRAIRGEGLSISTSVRDLVMSQGKSILVHDVRLDQDFGSQESILAQEIRSILAVPLQTAERVIGLLYLDSPHTVRKFTSEDLNLVTVMANIAAIRIEHARLMEQQAERKILDRELEHAARIQRRLLPSKAPEVAGFDLAGCSIPCRAVGGDYYDFLPRDGDCFVVLVGDVSGKGLGAALLMSNLQACAHLLFEGPEPLSVQVSRLNRRIAESCPGDAFITLFAAVLHSKSRELVYCNAGHNPALLIRKNGRVDALAATGIPLGIKRDASFEQNNDCLSSGDLLVLFSDGVTEARTLDFKDEFGEQRLVAVAQLNREKPAQNVIEAIHEQLASFTQGAPAADDITLLVVRCCDY